MPRKTRKKKRGPEVDTEAVRILRPLKEEEGFHFYTAVDEPTGENAESLSDFSEKIKSVNLESLAFHLQRKDFQKWVKNTLEDSKLAGRIGRIRPSHNKKLRGKICTTIENRLKELQG
ncbi:hypothetical protein GTO27_04065 [Candidatus Bathyarchaeota archaeon]|nr:hypothetical protein [Candidatus Bathyarchaeota archaeon]